MAHAAVDGECIEARGLSAVKLADDVVGTASTALDRGRVGAAGGSHHWHAVKGWSLV